MSDLILAVDQGTSSTKAIVFGLDGRAVASGTAPLETFYGPGGTAEQDPESIYQSVLAAVANVLTVMDESGSSGRIACVGIANQRETFVLWDKDGRPIHNAVVWQCKRSVEICNELKQRGMEPEFRSRTGLIIDPYFSGTKLTWLVRNDPAVAAALEQRRLMFGTVDTWLLYRLTGGRVYATDHSNASRTLLFNIHSLSWDEKLAENLEVPGLNLPAVRPSASNYGETDFEGLLSEPIPVTAVIGDSHGALFGERCFAPGEAKATLGTGCSILLNAGTQPPAPSENVMTTIGFSIPGRVDYALEGIIVSAGAILTWAGKQLGLFSDSAELDSVPNEVEGTAGVFVVPGHAGLGAPFWAMNATGSIHGLTFATDRRHVLRAVLESIPYQIRAVLDSVRSETGVESSSLRLDGGISRNPFVTKWAANTLGIPVSTLSMQDITALGAALLAGIGAGRYSDPDEILRMQLEEHIFQPDNNRESATSQYDEWLAIVEKTVGR